MAVWPVVGYAYGYGEYGHGLAASGLRLRRFLKRKLSVLRNLTQVPVQNFGNSVYPALPVSFGGDTKSRRSLLSGVYARGSKRSHQSALECVTVVDSTTLSSRRTTLEITLRCIILKFECSQYWKKKKKKKLLLFFPEMCNHNY